MNIPAQLIHSLPFILTVKARIREELIGTVIVHHSAEGALNGTVSDYELTAPLEFEPAECVGTTCAIAVRGKGRVTGIGRVEGDEGPEIMFATERSFFGQVDIAWPEGASVVSPEDLPEFIPKVDLVVTVEDSGFYGEENESTQSPKLAGQTW